jgi:Secretion system C-terminal sorting domain
VIENADLWGYSSPCFLHFSPTAPLSLLVGNKYGHVFQYENISNNLSGTFILQSNNFSAINCGERAAPSATQLLGNDSVEILCGAYRGGAQLYTNGGIGIPNAIAEIRVNNEQLKIYPNPTKNELTIVCHLFAVNAIEVQNVVGQIVICKTVIDNSNDNCKLNTENLPAGIYIIKTTDVQGFQHTAKFVKQE